MKGITVTVPPHTTLYAGDEVYVEVEEEDGGVELVGASIKRAGEEPTSALSSSRIVDFPEEEETREEKLIGDLMGIHHILTEVLPGDPQDYPTAANAASTAALRIAHLEQLKSIMVKNLQGLLEELNAIGE